MAAALGKEIGRALAVRAKLLNLFESSLFAVDGEDGKATFSASLELVDLARGIEKPAIC